MDETTTMKPYNKVPVIVEFFFLLLFFLLLTIIEYDLLFANLAIILEKDDDTILQSRLFGEKERKIMR